MTAPIEHYKSPAQWREQFKTIPREPLGYYQITVIHAVHGTEVFYLSLAQWQPNLTSLLSPYWINNYTIVMTSMDA